MIDDGGFGAARLGSRPATQSDRLEGGNEIDLAPRE
jgi:hypothetical protein